ncbi:MAG: DNA-directed RNA polymerase subunit beta [Candidatus Latescibacteria bacterium]|nr:DNA-directed RNA polymerase subunit beta [Candidatus Latescibacterota bacterium]NIM21563.1 DNA-directed RNA polymerase subunit beta [Candidatus Latescibacterota bacterium]NIM65830.1 DNA-directed RNA polymerase subunit beta [Candidatus Latescibacterota bacterium]NIO02362.1 DNA-directed RNA polymerase subunit beta [Candidatus Latescibacterota bacterium]NIO29224.1 DNA-directed RNA polymerase subunit beta [Candidatus Latescibacterota bacterium]
MSKKRASSIQECPRDPNGRLSFSKIPEIMEIPNLLAVQLESYSNFLQAEVTIDRRKNQGLENVFRSVFPIESPKGKYILEYHGYIIGEAKYTEEECKERDLTYAAPLKARMRLVINEEDPESKEKKIKDIIQSEVFLGEIPLLTKKGTFIINGAERVIVSQLHRSPGVFFGDEIHPNGKRLFNARIIPYRGSWVEFAIDINDVMFVNIDRRRKMPVTVLLKAMGFDTNQAIIRLFHQVDNVKIGIRASKKDEDVIEHVCVQDIIDKKTGEVIIEAAQAVTRGYIEKLRAAKITQIPCIKYSENQGPDEDVILKTLQKDNCPDQETALKKIYNLIRPGDPPNLETAKALLGRMFFNPKRYDLANVGRYKINRRLKLDIPEDQTTLDPKDFIAVIACLLDMKEADAEPDDIDHLGNRRIRSVGELLANQFSIGLARMARIVKERMTLQQESEQVTPYELINARTVSAVIQSFFGSSQLSQFMDQTNPLAELTHKRRLSALGPGGLTRERAGFEVRDVHYTHYGRMCPIETPEGPNIGLISSLSTYARINDYGFLETPYRKVLSGVATKEICYLSADEEAECIIAQANAPLDEKGRFIKDLALCRLRGDFPVVPPKRIQYMDVSPKQLVSAAASLIPFLEHDDANRALMGCNMQRQAVPLLKTEAPLIGTGMEGKVAEDSGILKLAKRPGKVVSVTGERIVVDPITKKDTLDDYSGYEGMDEYKLTKFKRSNQDTCINQKPVVSVGDRVKSGDVLADGPATDNGELALGSNVLVAFMPWLGYNFEDAILVSERFLKDDKFTSIHIEEFELQVRDTKAGMEEITREIPNVGEEALRNLDEEGIVRIGARVRAGNILVGKVTPKGETDLSPEERLLRAIFGEKAGDVRDASLKAPPGMDGIVVGIELFSRKERDDKSRSQDKQKLAKLKKDRDKEVERIKEIRKEKLKKLLVGQTCDRLVNAETGELIAKAGRKISEKFFDSLDIDNLQWGLAIVRNPKADRQVQIVMDTAARAVEKVDTAYEKEVERVTRGDELAPGVSKLVKVYVFRKRKLSVGDKMAGRHGNKGVVAKIVPEEDMPHLPDGTAVDIVLNPLGVPSRMNLGQILETHLGWAAHAMGYRVACPVFDGASSEEVRQALEEARLPVSGKSILYDGRTGEPFDHEVTVGYIYMMKLSHLVDDKIHARSIGPYSLVSQQPLGGKAQFGGQRFGEMEVWALEAYGAAYCLQELLTVKSDDISGRAKIYEAIVKGENPPEPGIPESFNVLVKELQSLGLDVELERG